MTRREAFSWGLLIAALSILCALPARVALCDDGPPPPDDLLRRSIAQLRDDDAIVRLKAAKTLGQMGPAAREAIPALTKLLEDPDEDVRTVAARALEKIRVPDDGAIAKLVALLSDTDAMVRLKAAKTLGTMGSAAKAAVPALKALADDPDEDVRLVAASALRKILGAGGDAPLPPPEEAKPDAGDIEVTDVRSLFCKPYRDPIGVHSTPAQRFFLVRLRNKAGRPVTIEELVLTWCDRGVDLRSEKVEIASDTALPGEQVWVSFLRKCDDQYYSWKIRAARIAARDLGEAEAQKLARGNRQRDAMSVIRVKPITSMGAVMGQEFTVNNPTGEDARGVRIAVFGFDAAGKLVEVQVLYADRLPPAELRIVWSMSKPEEFQKATSFFDLEEIVSAERLVDVKRYTGEILDVGAAARPGD